MSFIKSYKLLKEYRSNPLAFMTKMHELQGHRIVLNFFGKKVYVLSDPSDVIHILKNNHSAYSKGRTTKMMGKVLGKGLVTNEGDSWRQQHRLIRPVMNWKSVYDIAPRMLSTTKEYLPNLISTPEVDAFKEMNKLTWRIVLKTLFSLDVSGDMDEWLEDILDLMEILTTKTRTSIPLPFWIPTPDHLRLKQITKKFDQHVYGLIQERRQGTKKHDLLQLLIDAEEDGSPKMTDLEIRDEVMTFMMAGHETITNTMTWSLIELAKNPEYKEKLFQESKNFFLNTNFEELNAQPWTTAIIDESMRLWPAIWAFMREAEKADRLGELEISPKANVVLCPYISHRSKLLWSDPELFRPERFLPEERKKIPQGVYIPFGFGPRACIGAYFANLEAKIILTTIVHHFDWDIVNPEHQQAYAGISLRPLNNTVMKFRSRT